MNILEEAKRLLHSEDHRSLRPEIHAFIRAVAGLEPVAVMRKWDYHLPESMWGLYPGDKLDPEDDYALYILEPTND